MKRVLTEYGLFLREFWTNYHTTGAILPSGRWLAAALSRYVGKGNGPQRILEVGPGTGAHYAADRPGDAAGGPPRPGGA